MTSPRDLPSLPRMWRERVDGMAERGIHFLVVLALAFGALALGGTHPEFFAVLAGLGAAATGLWLVRLWVNPAAGLFWPPLAWAVVAFVLYAVVRCHFAPVIHTAEGELLQVTLYALMFFVVVNNLNRQHSANWVAGVMIAVAGFAAMYAVFQALTKSSMVWNYVRWANYVGRGSGTYICPNHLAGWLEMALPLAVAYLLAGRTTHLTRILLGYAVVVMLAGLVATQSRGGWSAVALSMLLMFAVLLGQRGRRVPAVLMLVALAGAALWIVVEARANSDRVRMVMGLEQFSDVRLHLWPAAIKIWQTNPWWGVGPGHFDHWFRKVNDGQVQARPERVHNDYLDTLAEWGVVGTVLVTLAVGLMFWGVFRIWRHVQREGNDFRSSQSNRTAFVLGASVGWFALLVHSIVDFNFHIPANALAAVVLMALLAAHGRFATSSYHVPAGLAGRLAVTVIGLVGAVWLAHRSTLRGFEAVWLAQAYSSKATLGQQAELLRRAHAWVPTNPRTVFGLGEVLRVQAFERPAGYPVLAEQAMQWFAQAAQLNPLDPYARLSHGMCLDLIGQRQAATQHFLAALALDPNGYFTLSHVGWHYCELEDWATARKHLQRAKEVPVPDYTIANIYFQLAEQRLAEQKR